LRVPPCAAERRPRGRGARPVHGVPGIRRRPFPQPRPADRRSHVRWTERCPRDSRTVPRAAPTGAPPPMGQAQPNASTRPLPSTPRFPPRTCHRRGCGHVFPPRTWNQRYCQRPECLRELHRWQAAQRQRQRRQQAEKRQQDAAAQRLRRRRRREQQAVAEGPGPPPPPPPAHALQEPTPGALSRSAGPEKIPSDFCDRPGGYGPLPRPRQGPAAYCGPDCAQAQRRVHDRERKFGQRKRKRKAARRRARRRRVLRRARRRRARRRASPDVRPHTAPPTSPVRRPPGAHTRPQPWAGSGGAPIFPRPLGTSLQP